MNGVGCKTRFRTACATKAGQRYENAREMALSLRGQPLPSQRRRLLFISGAVAALMFIAIGMWITQARQPGGILSEERKAPPMLTWRSGAPWRAGFCRRDLVRRHPAGAFRRRKSCPRCISSACPGDKHYELEHTAVVGKPLVLDIRLEKSRLPQAGERWANKSWAWSSPARQARPRLHRAGRDEALPQVCRRRSHL